MKYILLALVCVFTSCQAQNKKTSSSPKATTTKTVKKMKSIYDYTFEDINGDPFNFADLKGKKVMILNTASKCGYTKQYDALEKIYQQYKGDHFVIIGFPSDNFGGQEFDNNEEIANLKEKNLNLFQKKLTYADMLMIWKQKFRMQGYLPCLF